MEKPILPWDDDDAHVERRRMIGAPARHEGIGNALRTAFDPGAYGLPDDFAKLLGQMDR